MANITDVQEPKRSGSAASVAVLALFLASAFCQLVIPIIHAREVDAKECEERSCKGHPKSHVERELGPSHHDSNTCPVCQIIHSVQPAEVQFDDGVAVFVHLSEQVPSGAPGALISAPTLTASSPRAPPHLL